MKQIVEHFYYNFLVSFVPGLILYYGLTSIIKFSVGDIIISTIIIISISWSFGEVLELFFFKNSISTRKKSEKNYINNLELMINKIGIAISITSLIILISSIINHFNPAHERKEFDYLFFITSIKMAVFFSLGILLNKYRYHGKQ